MTKTNPYTRVEQIGENIIVVILCTVVLSVIAFALFGWPIVSLIGGDPWYLAFSPWLFGVTFVGVLVGIERGYNWFVRKWDAAKERWEAENGQ